MQVEVIEVSAAGITSQLVTVPAETTVAGAIAAAGLTLTEADAVSLWGRKVKSEQLVTEGARVELARPLVCDPKLVRKARAEAQGDIRTITAGRHGGRRRVETPKENLSDE